MQQICKSMDELLKQCRYYKGESDCPYASGIQMKFWWYEKCFVDLRKANDSMLTRYVERYRTKRIVFEDGTPVELQALLFNRYCHFVNSDGHGFDEYYQKYLRHNASK